MARMSRSCRSSAMRYKQRLDGTFEKPDSGHVGTISITVRACPPWRNAMKPWIQCVLAQ
jgi:hypothetical protein